MTKPWRNITTILSDKKNCVFVFISVNLTGDSTLRKDPLAPNQGFEKLVPPIKGFYSRRINIQHRLVYKVDQDTQTVIIYSAWSRYE